MGLGAFSIPEEARANSAAYADSVASTISSVGKIFSHMEDSESSFLEGVLLSRVVGFAKRTRLHRSAIYMLRVAASTRCDHNFFFCSDKFLSVERPVPKPCIQ